MLTNPRKSAYSSTQAQLAHLTKVQKKGLYTLYVPGVGSSYPFRISDKVHYPVGVTVLKGYYYEDNLPPMVMAKVKAKYPGKKIFGVTEISNQSGIKYHVVLEDEARWYNVVSDYCGNLTLD